MNIRLRTLPRFPATIRGGAGVAVSREGNGPDLSVKFDLGSLVRIPAVPDEDKTFFVAWYSDLDSYSIMSFGDIFEAVIDQTGFLPLTGGVMTGAIQDLVTAPSADPTKRLSFNAGNITAGQQRTFTVPDADVTISAFIASLLDDANASAVLSTLGVTAFAKTILDDPDAETARATLGVGSALLASGSMSGAGPFAVTLPAAYKSFRLVVTDLNYTTGASPFFAQISYNGGSSWATGASDYVEQTTTAAGTSAVLTSTSQAAASLILANSQSNGQRGFVVADFDPGSASQYPTFLTSAKWISSAGAAVRRGDFATNVSNSIARVNALRIFPGAGTVITGNYALYGMI